MPWAAPVTIATLSWNLMSTSLVVGGRASLAGFRGGCCATAPQPPVVEQRAPHPPPVVEQRAPHPPPVVEQRAPASDQSRPLRRLRDRLGLQVLLEPGDAHLPADAGLLVAA